MDNSLIEQFSFYKIIMYYYISIGFYGEYLTSSFAFILPLFVRN